MKTLFKKTDSNVRKPREFAGKFNPKFSPRAFDPVAYAAALEVLG